MKKLKLPQSNRCCYCRDKLEESEKTREHIVPLKRGGNNTCKNVKTCCYSCNQLKQDKTLLEFKENIENNARMEPGRKKRIIQSCDNLYKYCIKHNKGLFKNELFYMMWKSHTEANFKSLY